MRRAISRPRRTSTRWGGELQFVANDSNHYKFTGKERDSESGLDYFGARYYSNGLGRFISADWSSTPVPIPYADFGDPQSLNLYSYVRSIPTTRYDADGHQAAEKQRVPGLKNEPDLGELVEVKAGVCVCAGASAQVGPVTVNASGEPIGAEIKTNLAGDAETKLNIGKVGVGVTAGPASGQVEGGVTISSKDGVSPMGKATVNGVGVKVDANGVSPVAEVKGQMKLGGDVKLGAVKVGVTLNLSNVAQMWDAVTTNIPIITGAILDHFIPGAGTPSVGQSAPGSNDQNVGPNGRTMFQ